MEKSLKKMYKYHFRMVLDMCSFKEKNNNGFGHLCNLLIVCYLDIKKMQAQAIQCWELLILMVILLYLN